MDFSMDETGQQKAFRLDVRAWVTAHVPEFKGRRDSEENYQLLRKLGRQLGARGWLYPTAPVEYGGSGMSA
ncbi:MAG: pimeloyl-CoA dehydrogenase large subunit, partial [Dehalococcoidia bacterium]|nr:pimeloyl-CoA dehydrogenase large subunit [Dehalococcoidia bacterium]